MISGCSESEPSPLLVCQWPASLGQRSRVPLDRILGALVRYQFCFYLRFWGNSNISCNSDLCLTKIFCCCSCVGRTNILLVEQCSGPNLLVSFSLKCGRFRLIKATAHPLSGSTRVCGQALRCQSRVSFTGLASRLCWLRPLPLC